MSLADDFCRLLKKNKIIYRDILSDTSEMRIEIPYSAVNGPQAKINFNFIANGDIKISVRDIYKLSRSFYTDNILLILNLFNARFPYANLFLTGNREVMQEYLLFGYTDIHSQGLLKIFQYIATMLSALTNELLLEEVYWRAEEW